MDRLEALLHEDSDEDSDEGQGMKNAYSFEDLLGELDSDDDGKAAVKLAQPPLQTCHSDNALSVMQMKSEHTDGIEACASNNSQILSVVDDTEGVSTEECTDIPGQSTSTVDSADQLTDGLNDVAEHCSPAQVQSICSDGTPESDDCSRTYDEVLDERIYQNPFEQHDASARTQYNENVERDEDNRDIYENIDNGVHSQEQQYTEDDGWGSSEFEDYEDDLSGDQLSVGARSHNSQESVGIDQPSSANVKKDNHRQLASAAMKRLGLNRLSWKKSTSSDAPPIISPSAMFDKFTAKLNYQKTKQQSQHLSKDLDDDEDVNYQLQMIEVELNRSKHPPAELPLAPDGLTQLQEKRRRIIQTVVNSENSYASSLRRIVEEYEKPLLDPKLHLISRHDVRTIFHKIRDILQCHNMFDIELAEAVKVWDTEEKIGNVFTASFSKSIVFEVYSSFVNNFSTATQTIKKRARQKPAFANFLKQNIVLSEDRLSLFGLLVKPVQRFPQFIMLLQDLLKLTPKDHQDRLALQIALTELDTLTNRLNETKRESDNRLEVKRLLNNVKRHSVKIDPQMTCLIRHDDMIQIKQKNGETKTKVRRLFLLGDQLMCTSVIPKMETCIYRESESQTSERFGFVWSVPIKDVEIHEQILPSTFKMPSSANKSLASFQKPVATKSNAPPVSSSGDCHPYKKELDDMLHDLNILEQITDLAVQLRLRYEGFSIDTLSGVNNSLQLMIRQKFDIDKCLLTLSIPNRGNPRVRYTFQSATPALKHDWLLELHNAKLALEPFNHPAWSIPESEVSAMKVPIFMQTVALEHAAEIFKKQSKSKKKSSDSLRARHCVATHVLLPSTDLPTGYGVQHLWVCESNVSGTSNHVSIVSLHTIKPCIVESFLVPDCGIIIDVERVPGFSSSLSDKFAFNDDTVWMAVDEKILIYKVVEEDRSGKKPSIKVDNKVSCLKYLDGRMYVGCKNGMLYIISRDQDGVWKIKGREKVVLGGDTVSCLLPVNGVMWAACETNIHVISLSTTSNKLTVTKTVHELCKDSARCHIECMAKTGVGLMVTRKNQATVQLFHLETFEHLQDISVASAITRMLEGQQVSKETLESIRSIHITCLLSESGWLWIGTSAGFILTVPLPRLEGVPQVKGRPTVSFHGHVGPIQFVCAVHCSTLPINPDSKPSGVSTQASSCSTLEGQSSDGLSLTCPSVENLAIDNLGAKQWMSTPDLNFSDDDKDNKVSNLYDSLLRGIDADMDFDILTSDNATSEVVNRKIGHRSAAARHGITFQNNLSAVSNRVMNRLSHAVAKGHRSSAGKSAVPVVEKSSNNQTVDALDEESDTESVDPDRSSVDMSILTSVSSDVSAFDRTSPVAKSYRRITVPLCSSMVSSNLVHVTSNKSLIIVSGAEGYVGWSDHKYADKSCDDTNLLLWKC